MFERLRNAVRAALDAATPAGEGNLRDLARQMRDALIEGRAAAQGMREELQRSERELAAEQQRLADALRRGRLAVEIQDHETGAVAERFATRHRERVSILERKVAAQRDEISLADREVEEMREQLVRAERDRPLNAAERSAERAWRDLQQAGAPRPGVDPQEDLLKGAMDRAAQDRAADEQLRALKKRMKKD